MNSVFELFRLFRRILYHVLLFTLLTAAIAGNSETLTAVQVANHAYNAGFRGESLVIAVAVAEAESDFITDQVNENRDVRENVLNRDRGLWQINDYWHSEVPIWCSLDPDCAAREAFRISSHGTDWTPWAAYNNHRYIGFMRDASEGVQQLPACRLVQAQVDIDRFVDSDWRFQSAVSGLISNVDWLPEWELRYETYQFYWWWQVTVFHLTSKTSPSRWIAFWDPWSSSWSWHQIQ